MANEKRISALRRKLFSEITKAGITVQKDESNVATLNGIRVYLHASAVGVFPPEGAPLKLTFGPAGWSRRLTLREPKRGFDFKRIIAQLRTIIADENTRLKIAADNKAVTDTNIELAALVRRRCIGSEKSGVRICASSYKRPGAVNVMLDVDVHPDIATRIVKAVHRELATYQQAKKIRRVHSRSGQIRCSICSPLRCSKAD